jgi:hypothetical protein
MSESSEFNPKDKIRAIKGQDYLDVKWRIVWFRQECPGFQISTEISPITDTLIVVRATVSDAQGYVVSSGMATVRDEKNSTWSGRVVEKAETAAIGRALAHLGFGTAGLDDDDEHLADAPVDKKPQAASQPPQSARPAQSPAAATGEETMQNVKVFQVKSTQKGGIRIIAGDASGFPEAFKKAGIDTSQWQAGNDYELPFGLRVYSTVNAAGYRNITRIEPISDDDDVPDENMPF